ncbi:MAG: PEP-utilizing enzyme [Veillonella sp.]
MKRQKQLLLTLGGMTCHASIVSCELGIPCIVGTKSRSHEATTSIKDGQMITVDATNGIVYDGVLEDIVKSLSYKFSQVAAADMYL